MKARILELAFKHRIGHLGSHLTTAEILDTIYNSKKPEDIVILSSGHAALALYVALEKYEKLDAEQLFIKHGGHPHRDELDKIYCSTGSLGLGITVGIGRALANPTRKVYIVLSDGECAEGSVWESLRFIYENRIENIEVYVNMNGYAAYDKVDVEYLSKRLLSFLPTIHIVKTSVNQYPFLKGINAHYHVMSEQDYKSTL